jgi:hypothetical protein
LPVCILGTQSIIVHYVSIYRLAPNSLIGRKDIGSKARLTDPKLNIINRPSLIPRRLERLFRLNEVSITIKIDLVYYEAISWITCPKSLRYLKAKEAVILCLPLAALPVFLSRYP